MPDRAMDVRGRSRSNHEERRPVRKFRLAKFGTGNRSFYFWIAAEDMAVWAMGIAASIALVLTPGNIVLHHWPASSMTATTSPGMSRERTRQNAVAASMALDDDAAALLDEVGGDVEKARTSYIGYTLAYLQEEMPELYAALKTDPSRPDCHAVLVEVTTTRGPPPHSSRARPGLSARALTADPRSG